MLLVHPDQISGEVISDFRPLAWPRQKIATADIDLIFQRKGDGIASLGSGQVTRLGHDPLDARRSSGCGDNDLVSRRNTPRGY
ncbi:hypothetical protein [Bradyrhizobium sp. ISRA463]|uniref:hypothetical protein n=1 Tax=unclassified Bradyrhizobium TaxID=2631580 RepID=UPI0032B064F2